METTKSSIKLICQTDESGNLCPMAESLLENGKIKDKSIKKTCRSKSCVSSALEMYSSLQDNLGAFENLSITTGNNNVDSQSNISTIVDYFNSDECKNYKEKDVKSAANSIKIGSSLIVTFGLILISLY